MCPNFLYIPILIFMRPVRRVCSPFSIQLFPVRPPCTVILSFPRIFVVRQCMGPSLHTWTTSHLVPKLYRTLTPRPIPAQLPTPKRHTIHISPLSKGENALRTNPGLHKQSPPTQAIS